MVRKLTSQRLINPTPAGNVQSIEYHSDAGRTHMLIRLRPEANKEAISNQLKVADSTAQIQPIASVSGGFVIMIQSDKPAELLLETLRQAGERLEPPPVKSKLADPWIWRGTTSIIGQSLQIASSYAGTGTAKDRNALFGFAALNMVANATNIIFGAQKKEDPHQLRILAGQVNEVLSPIAGAEHRLPDASENLGKPLPATMPSNGHSAIYNTLQKYSVSGGEIGLRTLGAASLAFPIGGWGEAFKTLRSTGSLAETYKVAKNSNPVTFSAGLLTLLGKFVSMASKEPDPYNPKEPTLLDKVRQKITFPLSSVIEGYGAVMMTHDRFTKQKITFRGKTVPDFYGGVGNTVFVGGYGIRFMAPYGSLEVNLDKLGYVAAQSLAALPEDKREAGLLTLADHLSNHFNRPETHSTLKLYDVLKEALERELASKPTQKIQSPVPAHQRMTTPDLAIAQL